MILFGRRGVRVAGAPLPFPLAWLTEPSHSALAVSIARDAAGREPCAVLALANREINRAIAYAPEPDGRDDWQGPEITLAKRAGDCEDIALAKAAVLAACGLRADALAVVTRPDLSQRHAVLIAGGLVLDNLSPSPLPQAAAGYAPAAAYSAAGAFVFWGGRP